jgi:hypothetical protein
MCTFVPPIKSPVVIDMPAGSTRWEAGSQDAADIFGAIHRGLLPDNVNDLEDSEWDMLIDNWLESHPGLKSKYKYGGKKGGKKFRYNFQRNFMKVVQRYQGYKEGKGGNMCASVLLSSSLWVQPS